MNDKNEKIQNEEREKKNWIYINVIILTAEKWRIQKEWNEIVT